MTLILLMIATERVHMFFVVLALPARTAHKFSTTVRIETCPAAQPPYKQTPGLPKTIYKPGVD